MNDDELIQGWIQHFRSESEALSPAYVEMDDAVRDDPERAWRLILAILKQDKSDNVIACLAGGPLENLFVHHGALFIERVEQLAQQDHEFNRLLGGVWKNDISDHVWNRLRSARNEEWLRRAQQDASRAISGS